MLFDSAFKFRTREQLQQLGENARKSLHGRASLAKWFRKINLTKPSLAMHIHFLIRYNQISYFCLKAVLDKSGCAYHRVAEREECVGGYELWNKKQPDGARTNFLGTRILCQHSRVGRRNDTRIHQKSRTGRQASGRIWILI